MVRFKNRYFLVKVHPVVSSTDLNVEFAAPSAIASLLRASVEDNFGLACASKVNPSLSIKFVSPHTHLLIVRCARDAYRSVWSAMTFLSSFPGKGDLMFGIWQVIHISGTIRSCQMQAIKWHRNGIMAVLRDTTDEQTKAILEESLQSVEQTIRNLEA